ncbi:hypothetical protein MBCUT_20650 [Methanobrevibacter cuticularis]|uniref:Periplasmic copper-binding protein NosD beta helix domain-containing protein n=1 Tax=Methanobrevibacter cuticularis TaxID=47311 RepID=A0A166CGT9_9EURY|nr:right-handed parallel beta-helix repeat-containing protein [Methanobrevibacter cuticularis]KZX14493.1 hypothetical protein MBCUT_20650 [Methanobrevibacter cuticularis]
MKSFKPSNGSNVVLFSAKEIIITNENYHQYFNPFTGKLLSTSGINPGDTIKIGNVSNKAFIIDIPLVLTSMGPNDQIINGVIHLIEGSDGSFIINLKIVNNETSVVYQGVFVTELHGIWLTHTNNNFIFNNSVQVADAFKVFAMPMGWSSNNTIIHNRLISTWSSCMPMGQSHNNNISYNYMQTTAANIIYYNPYGHADYGGPADCYNNYISNNYLYAIYASDTTIGMQFVYSQHINTTIINNTLINQFYGISLWGINSTVSGNTLINMTAYAISINSPNLILENNTIIAVDSYYGGGIRVGSEGYSSNITVINNRISITNGCYYGIYIAGDNIIVKNNVIELYNFGTGMYIAGNNTEILNNNIKTQIDPGINLATSYAIINNNNIRSGSYGIYIKTSSRQSFYFNNIIYNSIVSNDYGIFLQGTIYNTTIVGNKIGTNASLGIFKDITDPFGDNISDNEVNDLIEDSTGIVINDNNFYNYFDKNGYFKLGILDESIVIILTHLTNKKIYVDYKMTLLSNGLANLLTNVTIIITSDGSGSIIKELNFYNTNINAIILENDVNSVVIKNNNITIISADNFTGTINGILVGNSENILIERNTIYLSGKNAFVYGISVTDSTYSFSKYINITHNSIILVGNNLIEGIYTDSMRDSEISNNLINLWGNGLGYGIATAYIKGEATNINIKNNIILVNVKKMAYLIELHISSNITIENNILEGVASGVYGIALYNVKNIYVINNEIKTSGGDLSEIDHNYDVLGSGNSAIYITSNSNNTLIKNNLIYTNARYQIIINTTQNALNNTLTRNYFIVDDNNIINYFTSNGEFLKGVSIQANDTLLFNNLTSKHYNLIFDIPLNISFYKINRINATFIFKTNSAGSNITGLYFNLTDYSAFILADVYNITISKNKIVINNILKNNLTGIIIAHNSYDNQIIANNISINGKNSLTGVTVSNFYENRYGRSPKSNLIEDNTIVVSSDNIAKGIYVSMADDIKIINNSLAIHGKNTVFAIEILSNDSFAPYPTTLWSNNIKIINNTVYGFGNLVYLIKSYQSNNTHLLGNDLFSEGNSSFAYIGYKTHGDKIEYNNIVINGSGSGNGSGSNVGSENWINVAQAGIYYSNGSSDNLICENNITSNYYPKGADYAIYIADGAHDIVVSGNYLVSNNGLFIANDAVYGNVLSENNTPYYIYVSTEGSDEFGNGSIDNPFKTISHAISQAYNRAIIYIINGTYYENNIFINKAITIKNYGGTVILNGKRGQIFIIANTGDLTIVGINFVDASGINGSVIYNNGLLHILDSNFYNNMAIDQGGVIFNNGNLLIDNSNFNNNTAYLGGVISNFGNVSISNSSFTNNSACSGGAIYSYHNSTVIIESSYFMLNKAFSDDSQYLYNDNETRLAPGYGGVIYNFGTLYSINTTYAYNKAISGGVIANSAYIWRSFNDSYLYILNSIFQFNNASSHGGAIYGQAYVLMILNSIFSKNEAQNDGGALNFSANHGLIDNSSFIGNTARSTGGALAISGNISISSSNIVNNSASYGGGISYSGDSSYGHVLNQLEILNSTIEGNLGLQSGGAFHFYYANVNITNSNILNNFAPNSPILYNNAPNGVIDLDNNWWGSNYGPSDDVWNKATYFRNWLVERSLWDIITGGVESGSDTGGNSGGYIGPGTGSSLRPGTGSGSGSGSGSGYGDGTGSGLGSGSGTGLGNGSGNGIGNGNGTGSGMGVDSNHGNSEGANSTNQNFLSGIGDILNPSEYSSSSSGGKSGGGSDGGQGSAGTTTSKNAYEVLEDVIKDVNQSNSIYILLAILSFVVLIILGYIYNNRRSRF